MLVDQLRTYARPALLLLAFANLIPLAGLLWWGWDAFVLLSLYWMETAVLGIWMILQLIAIALTDRSIGLIGRIPAAIFYGAFFTVHAGGFMAGHMMFLWSIFAGKWEASIHNVQDFITQLVIGEGLWMPLAILFVARSFEFFAALGTYLRGQSEDKVNQNPVIGRFYARIVIMHVSIIFGVMISAKIGKIGPLVVLVVLKTIGEVWQLLYAQKKAAASGLSTVSASAQATSFRNRKWNRGA